MFSSKERDDITYKLSEMHTVYGKTFDAAKLLRVWLDALAKYSAGDILMAIDSALRLEKHCPRPADIIHHIGLIRTDRKFRNMANDDAPKSKPCDPRIAQAWATYIRVAHGFELPSNMKQAPMHFADAVTICNEHCKRIGDYSGLLPQHRLSDI